MLLLNISYWKRGTLFDITCTWILDNGYCTWYMYIITIYQVVQFLV